METSFLLERVFAVAVFVVFWCVPRNWKFTPLNFRLFVDRKRQVMTTSSMCYFLTKSFKTFSGFSFVMPWHEASQRSQKKQVSSNKRIDELHLNFKCSSKVIKLYFNMKESLSQEALVHVGVWCLGEFGDHLVSGKALGPDNQPIRVTPGDPGKNLGKCWGFWWKGHI